MVTSTIDHENKEARNEDYDECIDLGKNAFGIHGTNVKGRVVVCKVLSRCSMLEVLANLPKCLVEMEASRSADYWEIRSWYTNVR